MQATRDHQPQVKSGEEQTQGLAAWIWILILPPAKKMIPKPPLFLQKEVNVNIQCAELLQGLNEF